MPPPGGCGRHIAHGPAAGGNDGTRRFFRLRRTCDGIGDGGGANSCRVHELFLFLVERGAPPSSWLCFENKGVAKRVPRRCMKRKGGFCLGWGGERFESGK